MFHSGHTIYCNNFYRSKGFSRPPGLPEKARGGKEKPNVFMKKICLLLACVICAFSIGCTPKSDKTLVRVNEVTHSIFYAPLYAAIERGFFAEKGLEIELTNGGGADKSMTALLSGSADIGLMGPEAAMYVVLGGKENAPQVFAQLTKRDGSFLISRTAEPEFNWTGLDGKEFIAGRKGGVPAMTLEYLLKEKGYTNGQNITLNFDIQFNLTAAAFEGGTGDYCTLFEPTASEFEKAGKGHVVASVGEASGEVPYTCFMALGKYIDDNRETVVAFTEALKKAYEFLKTASEEEIANALRGQFPGTSDESIVASIRRYTEIDAWAEHFTMKKSALDRLCSIMISAGELSEKVDYDKLVRTDISDMICGKIQDN